MKKIISLATLLALASCAKSPAGPSAPASTARASHAESAALLASSKGHTLESLLSAAADLARSGESLSTDVALKCWKAEKSRPQVQEACLLAWSSGTGALDSTPAEELTEQLHSALEADVSRNTAIALVRRQGFVSRISADALDKILVALRGDPPWLRAFAVRAWLEQHKVPDAQTAQHLWSGIALPAEAPDPQSLSLAYLVARQLGGGQSAALTSQYCAPLVEGAAASRCLRFLSTLAEAPGGFPEELRQFQPPRASDAWRFFQRTFPERANLLDRFL